MTTNRVQVGYIDEDGDSASHAFYVDSAIDDPADVGLQALVAAIGAITNAEVAKISLLDTVTLGNPVGTGAYDAEDKALMSFLDEFGNVTKMMVPAPKRVSASSTVDVFKADDDTVDETAVIITEFVSAVLAVVVSKGGQALLKYLAGKRARKGRQS